MMMMKMIVHLYTEVIVACVCVWCVYVHTPLAGQMCKDRTWYSLLSVSGWMDGGWR